MIHTGLISTTSLDQKEREENVMLIFLLEKNTL